MSKGILLIGFGSSKPNSREVLILNTEKLRASGENAYYAFIGRDNPTIEDALAKMNDDGVDDIVITPFLMSTGEMSLNYIPRHVGIPRDFGTYDVERSVATKVRYTKVMGESPMISDMIDRNIRELDVFDASTGIMLVTPGSQLRYSSIMAQENANRLGLKGYNNVLTAFSDYNEPSVEDCAEFLVGRGVTRIIVVPLFIADDDNLIECIKTALGMYCNNVECTANIMGKDIEIRILGTIGTDPMITDILQDMIRVARS